MVDRILRLPEVLKVTGLGKTTIYDLIKTHDFPAPVKLSKRAVGWPESLVRHWLEARC